MLRDALLDGTDWDEAGHAYAREHDRHYGFSLPGEAVEMVNLRTTALRPEEPIALRAEPHAEAQPVVSDVNPLAALITRAKCTAPRGETRTTISDWAAALPEVRARHGPGGARRVALRA